VRGAAIVTLLLLCVPSPPWEWLENPFALFLIIPLSILFLAILWRLRKMPYKDGLALAMAVGGVLFLLAGLGVFTTLSDVRPNWNWVGFFALFAAVQAILVGGAVATYRALGYAKGDWTLFAPASGPDTFPVDRPVLAKGLWAVRGAAIGTMLLICVPFPPWRWPEMPAALFLLLLLFVPFLMILWRLRRAPRKDGLALAMGVGGVLIVGVGLFVVPNLSDLSRFDWGTFPWLGLFIIAQAILSGGAVVTYRHLGYAKGDWKLLTRGVVDPLVYFAVMALIISASGPLLYKQRLRHYAGEAAAWSKQLHACATTYAAGHPAQGFPARLELLGPDGTKCLEPLPPTGEKAGYVFTYAPSPPEAGGKIPAYSVTARRVDRVAPRERSFYMDATGVIHATSEDRDATPQDPIVQ
jgi:hypothetical protein